MSNNDRPRGVMIWPMPEEVCGPFDRYALAVRDNSEGVQCRMVHTEGVAYLVTEEKPWQWNDYDPNAKVFTMQDLRDRIDPANGVDLADWVRNFGARLESNFRQVYAWINEE